MDKTSLESSIREESQRAIRAIRKKEASEVETLDEACAAEIENFRRKTEGETEAKIAQELSRLENRDILERKKLKLRIIEDFINHIVKEAVQEMRNDPRYKKFLLHVVCDAAEKSQAGVEIRLKTEDRVFEKKILEAVKADGRNRDIVVHEDSTIKWGGCIVHDEPGGRRFNSTIERIYFRKSPMIRQEVMRILKQRDFSL